MEKVSSDNLGIMKIKEDLTGRKFGYLTVITRDISKIGLERGSFWICSCKCGNSKSIARHSLVNHGTKSCGCLTIEKASLPKLPGVKAEQNYWIAKYKRRAKQQGVSFEFTDEEFFVLSSLDCFYCGAEPIERTHGHKYKIEKRDIFKTNGLDRINPKEGYTKENCVPCCTDCNLMKTDKTKLEFMKKILKIFNNLRSKNVI